MSSSNSVAVTVEDGKMSCEVFDVECKTLEKFAFKAGSDAMLEGKAAERN